jgi:hypothetical protein
VAAQLAHHVAARDPHRQADALLGRRLRHRQRDAVLVRMQIVQLDAVIEH